MMARDLIKNNESLKWMQQFVPNHISHQYDDLVTKISQVVWNFVKIMIRNCYEIYIILDNLFYNLYKKDKHFKAF